MLPCESLTQKRAAPLDAAPSMAALTSCVIHARARSYAGPLIITGLYAATPPMPSMSTEIHTLDGSRFGTVRDGRRSFVSVPTAGLEPALPCGNRLLKTAPKPIRLRRRRCRLYRVNGVGMPLQVAPPDPVLALKARHIWIAVEEREKPKAIALSVPKHRELVTLRRRRLDAEPSLAVGVPRELHPKPLEVRAARGVEADHDPFIAVVRVGLLGRGVREVRDPAVAV